MKSWKIPTPEQVAKAIALLGHGEQYRYFFDRLENPLWIHPLKQKGFFKNPPQPVRDDVDGTISFLPWAESRYLARIAPSAASAELDAILEIILQLETDNVRVHEDLVDAALAMPADLAAKIAPKVKGWIALPYILLLPSKVGSLISHLAKGSQIKAALDLTRNLLAISADEQATKKASEDPTRLLHPQPLSRFDHWNYGEILKEHIPVLVEAAWEPAFLLLCNLLDTATRVSQHPDRNTAPEDYSYIWRPAIEDHVQNVPSGLVDMLISSGRNAAEQIATADKSRVTTLVKTLETQQWRIFQRIALHLLRRFRDVDRDLVSERLTDRELFDEPGLRHEYFLLMQDSYSRLSSEQQKIILDWIEAGPDLEQFKASREKLSGYRPTEEEAIQYGKSWRLRCLIPIKAALSSEWKEYYDELLAEVGEPDHPEFVSYSSGVRWGPTSPKHAEDLCAMSVEEIILFLKSWRASPDTPSTFLNPTPEGLGRELTACVASEPARFGAVAEKFETLDPTYIRAFLAGLLEAIKQKHVFPWLPVIRLCHWVMGQPRDFQAEENVYIDSDSGWGWTRKSIAELLGSGFEANIGEIPFDLRVPVWEVIRPITDDPDPTPSYEARYGGSNMDPATLSINTTRGEAMHGVVRYALWVRRNIEKMADAQVRLAHGFTEILEVREVLDYHLDPTHDPSLAIRAVYGQWFPWLVLLDPQWATENLERVFPRDDDLYELRNAAWKTYLIFCGPYDDTFNILEKEYRRAVERLNTTQVSEARLADHGERLAEHLVVFYWRGKLSLNDPNGLLARFYAVAPSGLRGHVILCAGRSLYNSIEAIPPQVLKRLQMLWTHRIEAIRAAALPSSFAPELSAFGWWFASGKFDDDWSIAQLKEVLQISGRLESDHLVAERLAELAATMPELAIECLSLMVERDQDGWAIHLWQESAGKILRTALQRSEMTIRQSAIDLINRLGTRGYLGFRDLLSDL